MSDMVSVSAPVRKKETIQELQPVHRPVSEEPRQRSVPPLVPSSPQKVGCALWFVIGVCAIILAITIGGLLASARIEVTSTTFSGTVDTSVVLSQELYQGGIRFFTATQTFSEEAVVPAETSVGRDTYASGRIRFYNTTAQKKVLPAKTKVTSAKRDGTMVRYQTKNTITIPAAQGKIPGQQEVVITAEQPGSDANLGPNDFLLVVPVAGVTARSVSDITGGVSSSDKVADIALVNQAQNHLIQTSPVSTDLITRMKEEVPEEMVVLPVTFADATPSISIESQHADGVHVVARKTITITMVRRGDLARFLGDRLRVPKNQQLMVDTLEGLSLVTGTLASASSIPTTMNVRISGNAMLRGFVDSEAIKQKVAGLSKAEAKTWLASVPEISQFTIHTMPFWRTILPLDLEKITVKVVHP